MTKPSVATLVLNDQIMKGSVRAHRSARASALRGVETLLNGLSYGFEKVIRAQLHGLETFIQTIASFTDLIGPLLELINSECYASVWCCKSNS